MPLISTSRPCHHARAPRHSFEPYDGVATNDDGAAYGRFLTQFADALHAAGKVLSLDYFSNDAIWNLPAMNSSTVDTMISMDTYVQNNETFEAYHQVALGHLDATRLGLGMCTGTSASRTPYGPDPCPADAWTAAQLRERFAYLDGAVANGRLAQLNLWVLPLPDLWWSQLNTSFAKWRTSS